MTPNITPTPPPPAEKGEAATAALAGLKVAFYFTGHGLGHATRAAAVVRALADRGAAVVVVSAVPGARFLGVLPPPARGGDGRIRTRLAALDCGARQADALTVDGPGSLAWYWETAGAPPRREELLAREEAWLRAEAVDCVLNDVAPLACVAARRAGVPHVACVSNFSWDFIYRPFLAGAEEADRAQYAAMVEQITADYGCCDRLLRLPGHSPMPGFAAGRVVDVPLVVRPRAAGRAATRARLGVPAGHRLLVLMFGGWQVHQQGPRGPGLPADWTCVVCGAGAAELPAGFVGVDFSEYTPDLIAASDAVLGKIGYGMTSEVLASNVPLIYIRRPLFEEEAKLAELLQAHGAGLEMRKEDFFDGKWAPYLERASGMRPQYGGRTDGADFIARHVEGWVGPAQAKARAKARTAA